VLTKTIQDHYGRDRDHWNGFFKCGIERLGKWKLIAKKECEKLRNRKL
jgi:hypothetical protein